MSADLGHVVQYGKPEPKLPRYIVKKVNLADPTGGISANDLFKSPALAYEDGYADGREYGERFIALHYSKEDTYQYAAGFKAGLRVREHIQSLVAQQFNNNNQEVRTESVKIP